MARQQAAAVQVRDGERVAPDPIPGSEVALDVGRPKIIRLCGHRWPPRVLVVTSPPPHLLQPLPRQQVAGRAAGRKVQVLAPQLQPVQQLPWPQLGCRRRASQINFGKARWFSR